MVRGFRQRVTHGLILWTLSVILCGGNAPLQAGTSSGPQNSPSAARSSALEPGKPLERAITGAETQYYQLALRTGQLARVTVEQRDINLKIELLGSDHEPVLVAEDELTGQGTQTLDIVATADGTYAVAIKPRLKDAKGAYHVSVEVRDSTADDHTLFQSRQLSTKARGLLSTRQYQEGLAPAQQALALAKQVPAADDAYVALVTRDLGEIQYRNRNLPEAKLDLEQALAMLTAARGAHDPQTVLTMATVGRYYQFHNDWAKAVTLLGPAVTEEERIFGPADPLLVSTLTSLAVVHMKLGDLASADRELHRGLSILEQAGLTDDAGYGDLLNDTGILYINEEQLDKATLYLERSLAWREKKFGADSQELRPTLINLGVVAKIMGNYDAAEKYYLRVLKMLDKTSPPESLNRVTTLANLGFVYKSEGQYQKALETLLRTLRILEKEPGYGDTRAKLLEGVAETYAAQGDFHDAQRTQEQLEKSLEEQISLNLVVGSERQKLAYLDSTGTYLDDTISLSLESQPGDSSAAALAATAILRRKGRVFDALVDTFASLRKHSDPQDQILLDQFKEATTQLAHATLQGPQQSVDEYRKALEELVAKKENLENTIGRHNAAFRVRSQAVTLETVQAAIPPDAVLLEFVTYRLSNPKAKTEAEEYGDLRYAVFVVHNTGIPQGIDLGDAKVIDADVAQFRVALRDPGRNDVKPLARALGDAVLQPVQSLLKGCRRLLISPDGQLNLIPFEALIDSDGRYLVQQFSISYVSTGRDLLRMQAPQPNPGVPVLVANPWFGEPAAALSAGTALPAKPVRVEVVRRSVTTGSNFSSLYFAPLAGTTIEAERIHALFPDARLLTGKQASGAELDQVKSPKILHIATHGFFLGDLSQATNDSGGDPASSGPENPLLRSGLALAGANLVKDGKGDGILTALEASNLDLWGTKLVTLSACDTGVGEVKNGEGVYGLRRAFVLAGAESLVMSLWPVSDRVTREIMTSYYTGLEHGMGRGEALRQAELAMLKRKDRRHPFYWASFIQSGEWANLDGQR